jgi:hypothetical protein
MNRYIPENIRFSVAKRANFKCEYCKIHQEDLHFTFQIDHIISLKHAGNSLLSNLAFACLMCNQNKGTDLGTYLSESRRLTRIFNPRLDKWTNHFETDNGLLLAKTRIGEATVKLLELNHPDRLILRNILAQIGRFP